jgi:hypothetical protein
LGASSKQNLAEKQKWIIKPHEQKQATPVAPIELLDTW